MPLPGHPEPAAGIGHNGITAFLVQRDVDTASKPGPEGPD